MPHFEANGGAFQVHCSGDIAKLLKSLQKRASKEGRGEEMIAAFEHIVYRLRHDPASFGEPLYQLPALQMDIRLGVVQPLVIHFGLSKDQLLVFIKVHLLSKAGS
jgi:hypothetical protein